MTQAITDLVVDQYLTALYLGIGFARRGYKRLAGQDLIHAPEHFVTGYVAEALRLLPKVKRVTLESEIPATVATYSAIEERKRFRELAGHKRFDIVVWGDRAPIALVEVKHGVTKTEPSLHKDVKRLAKALSLNSRTQRPRMAFVAFYMTMDRSPRWPHLTAKQRVDWQLRTIGDNMADFVSRQPVTVEVFRDTIRKSETGCWCPAVIQLVSQ